MVRDYFSVFSKDENTFLLRIHQKVDFADEIAWAHCWFCSRTQYPSLLAPFIVQYIEEGFDVIEKWSKLDQIGWHESIKHLGFKKELVEMELVPKIILGQKGLPNDIGKALVKTSPQDRLIGIPTYVGNLSNALNEAGISAPQPRVEEAIIEVPLKNIISSNWVELIPKLEAFS